MSQGNNSSKHYYRPVRPEKVPRLSLLATTLDIIYFFTFLPNVMILLFLGFSQELSYEPYWLWVSVYFPLFVAALHMIGLVQAWRARLSITTELASMLVIHAVGSVAIYAWPYLLGLRLGFIVVTGCGLASCYFRKKFSHH